MDRVMWQATVHGVAKSRTRLQRLSSSSLLSLFLFLKLQEDTELSKYRLQVSHLFCRLFILLSVHYFLKDSLSCKVLLEILFPFQAFYFKELFLVLRLFLFSKEITEIQLFFLPIFAIVSPLETIQISVSDKQAVLKCVVILSCGSIK